MLFVVPKAMQVDIIKQTHEKGHFGVRKIEQLLKREFWFSNMHEKIDKVIKNVSLVFSLSRSMESKKDFCEVFQNMLYRWRLIT